ncbi:7607_t:CDS:2 [Entrophospora sp. SA101]|nr:7607_t:CDS:2 [Entrophospora sp. SA101]CAJ0828850.1 16107_t:CDS:2 [Entrophospora sp. SA101]
MNFHEYYSELLKKLPPSIKKNIWNRLTSRVHNPLTEEQASSINPDIEALLISEIDKYEKKKNRYRIRHKVSCSANTQVTDMCPGTSSTVEEEINARVKEATDKMHQRFIETTQETLNSIKQQKDAECKKIKLDMANRE